MLQIFFKVLSLYNDLSNQTFFCVKLCTTLVTYLYCLLLDRFKSCKQAVNDFSLAMLFIPLQCKYKNKTPLSYFCLDELLKPLA